MRIAKLECLILFLLLSPALALAAKDTSDYPLRVELLSNTVERYRPYKSNGFANFMYRANGRGNVGDGSTMHAFDFRYDSNIRARLTLRNETYLAKWKKPQHELEVLVPEIGKDGRYQACDMQTTVHEGVLVRTSNGLIEMSQADYEARQERREAAKAAQAQGQPAAVSNLSVTSNPDSAEIEVDGALMGTTPSVFHLDVGAHTITLHKTGYKPWERKMTLVAGEIKLNADLEPEQPK
jgi:hypothetical protein